MCCCCLVIKLCLTLCDPVDWSLPGCSVHGISQARILEWVAIFLSRGSSQPRDQTQVSCTAGGFFTVWASREAQGSHLINSCSSSPLNFLPFTIHPVFIKLHAAVIFMLPFIISMDYHQSFMVCCSLPCFLYLKLCSISLTSLTQTSHTSCHRNIVET